MNLSADCLQLICSNLTYVDVMSLRLSSKGLNLIKMPNFVQLFQNALVKYRIVPDIILAKCFCDNLWSSGAYVAGSFILDVLYQTDYHNDLDVFDPSNPNSDSRSVFKDEDEYMKFTQSFYKMGFGWRESVAPDSLTLIRSYAHLNGGKPKTPFRSHYPKMEPTDMGIVQVIPVGFVKRQNERSVVPRFIQASFDLDICMSAFDGTCLFVRSWNKLIEKYDYIKPNTKFMLKEYIDGDGDILSRTEKRKQKYIDRGFKIEKHLLFNEISDNINKITTSNIHLNVINNNDIIKYIDDGSINLDLYHIA